VFSGKRYSGKDCLAVELFKQLEKDQISCCNKALGLEFKMKYATTYNVDYERLLNDREYKEIHRDQMTIYFKTIKNDFAENVANQIISGTVKSKCAVVTDVRQAEDIQPLLHVKQICPNISVLLVRINASDNARLSRGWLRTSYDDHICETDLDNYQGWDVIFDNSSQGLEHIEHFVSTVLKPKILSCINNKEANN